MTIIKPLLSRFMIRWLLPMVFLIIGGYFFHINLFKDGMEYIHGDLGDSRLISLLLEHSFRYLFQVDSSISFWSPYWIYYPAKNGLAYSDVMTAGVFLYAPWRLLGIPEMTAYQLWFLTTSVANFGAFLLLARRLGFSSLGSVIGGYIVSFGMINIAYANHPQMLSHYYLLLAIYFFLRIFHSSKAADRHKFSALAAIMYSLQFWLAFYPLWFFTFIGGMVGIFLVVAQWKKFRLHLKLYTGPALTFLCVAGLLIYPIARRYFIIKNLMGSRKWEEVSIYLPSWQAYILPTAESLIYKQSLFDKYSNLFVYHSELCMFSGFVVLITPVLFLICSRFDKRDSHRRLLLSAMTFGLLMTMLLTLKFVSDERSFSLWKTVFDYVPGASAIRAVGRVSLLLQIINALLMAYCITLLQKKFRWGSWIGLILVVLIVIENSVEHNYLFSKTEHYKRIQEVGSILQQADKNCSVFHRSYRHDSFPYREIDAMLVSQQLRIPTSNGYSGGMPPAYWNADIFRSQSVDKIMDWFNMNNRPIEQNKICFLP